MPLHADEMPVDAALVRRLLTDQLPAYASLPVAPLAVTGSTNALFRLGEDLLVRLPRQPGGAASIRKEARWSGLLADRLPARVPEVVAVGRPGPGYSEQWSVVRWVEGAQARAGEGGTGLASDLADTVRALGEVAVPPEALADPGLRWYRGEPLSAFDDSFRLWLHQCRSMPDLDLDLGLVQAVWDRALRLPAAAVRPHWLHADLLCENLLVDGDRLAAVLDLGALTVGDPTVDLVVAWEALTPPARDLFRRRTGVDDATWLRGRAWALAIAVMTLPYYWDTMPQRCSDRLVMARAALSDARA